MFVENVVIMKLRGIAMRRNSGALKLSNAWIFLCVCRSFQSPILLSSANRPSQNGHVHCRFNKERRALAVWGVPWVRDLSGVSPSKSCNV